MVREWATEAGFDQIGFVDPRALTGWERELDSFLDAGFHGSMTWMETRKEQRRHPNTLWPDARSVVMLGMNYGPEGDPLAAIALPDRGAISVYARHRDYHDLVKKRLKQVARRIHQEFDCEVKVFVDTAPVMEKPLAMAAGLGWQGKHTNLVSSEFGSWLFLGAIFVSLPLGADDQARDQCGTCQACIDICPTGAIVAPYQVDARKCISYLTIEHKDDIPEAYLALMGNRIYGCDDCLAVCPWNKFASETKEIKLLAREELVAPKLAELALLDDAGFRQLFSGSPIKRIGRDRFVRNVLIAIGNSGHKELAPVARKLVDDDAAIVRKMASWALSRLTGASPSGRDL